jgi:DNA repair ATPase RecN
MLQVRTICLKGARKDDATISFEDKANNLAGESDTGKSYLLHCLDYIFGADEFKKRIPQAEPYSQLYVEFANDRGEALSLERSLSGGGLAGRSEGR